MKKFWKIIFSCLRFFQKKPSIEDFLVLISKKGCKKISAEIKTEKKSFVVNFVAHDCEDGQAYLWSETKTFPEFSVCFKWILNNMRIAKNKYPQMELGILFNRRKIYDDAILQEILNPNKFNTPRSKASDPPLMEGDCY